MRFILLLLTLLMNDSGILQAQQALWNETMQRQRMQQRDDPAVWDTTLLHTDLQGILIPSSLFMRYGAFPVPQYDLCGKGSFKGLGNYQDVTFFENRTLVSNRFYIKKNAINAPQLGTQPDDVFFMIVVLTDSVDTTEYAHGASQVISRNHPDYIGQGSIFLKHDRIDYLAFTTASGPSYAIINTRLFDLKYGRLIFIAPQKDGSLRSMQIATERFSNDEGTEQINMILHRKDVLQLILSEQSIH